MKMDELERYVLDPSLKLWLPLSHIDAPASGANIRSRDAYGVVLTPSGPYWTPDGWYFDGVDDQIIAQAAATTHLDFTSEDYSVTARIRYVATGATQHFCSRFQWNQVGWAAWISGGGAIQVYTFQAAANQQSSTPGLIADGHDYTVGFSRRGTSLRVYINGVDQTTTVGVHSDPLTASRNLGVGCSAYATGIHKGLVKAVAAWNRALAPQEHADLHYRLTEVFG